MMYDVTLAGREDLFHGIFSLQQTGEGVRPLRMSERLLDFYRGNEAWLIRAYGTSGVRLQFRTTARRMALSLKLEQFCREYFGFDVICNGELVKRMTQNTSADAFSFDTELPGDGLRTVTVAFPWQAKCTVISLQLDDASVVEPMKASGNPMVMIGDSITQGFEVASPSESYAARLTTALGREWYNLSVGGMIMQGETAEAALDYPWDTAVLAYGVNDCARKVPIDDFRQETLRSLDALTSRAGAKIYVIAPLPWPGEPEGLSVQSYRDVLGECAEKYPQAILIHGKKLLENDKRYFADSVHPNALGMEKLAQGLLPIFNA